MLQYFSFCISALGSWWMHWFLTQNMSVYSIFQYISVWMWVQGGWRMNRFYWSSEKRRKCTWFAIYKLSNFFVWVTKCCCDATRHKFPHVLTDLELPLNPLNVAVPVLSLDGVAVAHQLHKLFGQDAVLEGGGRERQRDRERRHPSHCAAC